MSRIDKPSSRRSSWNTGFRELLGAGLPPRPFWQRFLQLAMTMMKADAGLLWEVQADHDRLVPQGVSGETEMREQILQRNAEQISHVVQSAARDDPVVFATGNEETETLPGRVILSIPYHAQQNIAGVLELILSKQEQGTGWHERVEALQEAIAQSEQQLDQADAVREDDQARFWPDFEDFSYQLHRSLVLSNVIDVAVNDGRQILGCDRLSLAVLRGRKVRVQGVSGSEKVNWRSQEVRSLQDLAREAISVGEVLEFRGDEQEFAPHVGELFAHHVELTGARLIAALPLYAPANRKPGDERSFNSEPERRIVGCLLIEQFHEARLPARTEPQLPLLSDHIGGALANALSHEQVFLLPTRRWLGKGLDFFRGRLLAKTLLVLGVLLTLIVSLIVIPWEYRVEAEGRLMPVGQRRLFAPHHGIVVSVAVDNGDEVTVDQELLRIHDDELHEKLVALQNELSEKRQLERSLRTKVARASREADRDTELELKGELAETTEQVHGLEQQIAILQQREDSLIIRSPIEGVVATFQVKDKLLGHPVERGDRLLEVMDKNGPWRLELELPEHRMGHLLRAIQSGEKRTLPVEYMLATDVDQSFSGQLTESGIANRSEVNEDTGTVVQLYVETDKSQLPFVRIGAEATGKVDCGKRSLGYVLLGDVWEFVLRYVWF